MVDLFVVEINMKTKDSGRELQNIIPGHNWTGYNGGGKNGAARDDSVGTKQYREKMDSAKMQLGKEKIPHINVIVVENLGEYMTLI